MALVSNTKSRLALQIDVLSMALPMKRFELLPQRCMQVRRRKGRGSVHLANALRRASA